MNLPEKTGLPPFTWALLKEFCNGLSDDQLKQEVIIPQDESSIKVLYASELGENQYNFYDYEYCTSKEDYDPDCVEGKTFDEALATEEYAFIPATNVYLFDE